jgi:apolipoprotein N-acyltransferase
MTHGLTKIDRRPSLWLVGGVALVAVVHLEPAIGVLAWIAPIPWLRHLRVTRGLRARAAFAGAWTLAWIFAVAKIVTAPVPLGMVPALALPVALFQGAPYLAWAAVRPHLAPRTAAALFAAVAAVADFGQHSLSPLASWGSPAYTQLDHLPLLQLASVAGLAGVTFLVSLVAALLEAALASSRASARRSIATAVTLVVAAHAFGQVRLALAERTPAATTLAAAIDTDSDMTGLPFPDRARTEAWDAGLLERTRRAAAGGARLVVWPEAATVVHPEDEGAWLERLSREVRAIGVDVVIAYVVPTSEKPLRYENRARLLRADGEVGFTAHKRHPAPGEPSIRHDEPIAYADRDYGRLSASICYDYDFPRLSLAQARLGVDLVALPASDWRGIDPIHARMASVRAIESGQAIVRATRWGLSVGVDPHGRIRGWRSAFDPGDGVLLVAVPARRVATVYGAIGDLPVGIAGAYALCAAALALARARGLRRSTAPAAAGPA